MDEGKTEIDDLKKQVETLNDVQRKQGTKRRRSNASITSSNEDSDDNDKSEQIDQLEEENMELLAKLQKTEKELQEARQKSDSKALFDENPKHDEETQKQIELTKETKEAMDKMEEKIKELNNRLALAIMDVTEKQAKQIIEKEIIQKAVPAIGKEQRPDEDKKDLHEDSAVLESTQIQAKRSHISQIR